MSELAIKKTPEKLGIWPAWELALQVGDDDRASRLLVVEKTMRIGRAIVRFGGVAGVETRREYRLKGYASRVMEASTAMMAERGCDMAILYGIGDFYHRFGYGVVFPISRLVVKTEALLRAAGPFKIRALKGTDARAVQRLYNRHNRERNASVVRPAGWSYFEMSQDFNAPGRTIVVEDTRGRIQAYATWQVRDGQFLVAEVGGTGDDAFASLGKALGQRAKRAKMDQVIFDLPRDDAFADFCIPLGCEQRVTYPQNSGAMGRIVHMRPLMEKLVPELSKRSAGFRGRVSVAIETDIGTVGLGIDRNGVRVIRGGVLVVKMSQLVLTQLVMGYRSAADVAADPMVSVPNKAMPVLDLLFPKRDGYMWWSDRF
jgi:predicted acetyltransferase